MSFFTIKTENNGSGTPFIARLLMTMLELREKIFITDDEKLQFDIIYEKFYVHAKLAYFTYKELQEIHNKYLEEIKAGAVVSIKGQTLYVDKVIDSDVQRLTNALLSEMEIAFKELINQYPKLFDDFSLGFMAQKDKKFQEGLIEIQEKSPAFAEYLKINREKWIVKLSEIRNKKEHHSWNLPEYAFNIVNGSIFVAIPQIDGKNYMDFLRLILASLFTFAEEIVVYTLSKNIPFGYVYEIPKGKRRTDVATRFGFGLFRGEYEPWVLHYKDPDMDLIK